MGSSLAGAELPGLKSQIIPCPIHTLAVTVIQKGIYRPALERLFGHNGLTTTEIQHKLLPAKVLRKFRA
jgi:site-specific recombinase XerD